jgi:hypothetical protein
MGGTTRQHGCPYRGSACLAHAQGQRDWQEPCAWAKWPTDWNPPSSRSMWKQCSRPMWSRCSAVSTVCRPTLARCGPSVPRRRPRPWWFPQPVATKSLLRPNQQCLWAKRLLLQRPRQPLRRFVRCWHGRRDWTSHRRVPRLRIRSGARPVAGSLGQPAGEVMITRSRMEARLAQLRSHGRPVGQPRTLAPAAA